MRALTLVALVALAACSSGGDAKDPVGPNPPGTPDPDSLPLRTLAGAKNRYFGTAVGGGFFTYTGAKRASYMGLLDTHFSMLTPENEMKHSVIHPGATTYNFGPADALVAHADSLGMQVRGHTLAWHNQNAGWLNTMAATWTAVQAESVLVAHITTVMTRYKGKVYAWDVVNEALLDNGAMRPSLWYNALGTDYIRIAFEAARAADSTALLFINDYSIEHTGPKSDSLYTLVQGLIADSVPIDGVGFQAHFISGASPSPADFASNMARFTALGLKAQLTELDVRVTLPNDDAKRAQQAVHYADAVGVCLGNPSCDAIVVWGLSDNESWVPGTFAGQGDALLFDSFYYKKPAFRSVYALLKQ